GRTRASVNIKRPPQPISPPQPIGTGLNPMLLPRPTRFSRYSGRSQHFERIRTNSEFHGGRFAHGGERRAPMLHDGLFVVVEAEVEGPIVQPYASFS
ncbi:hypothetical protein K443DRAFT_117450, partial [Laccaria amethystina LaAM-08-1]